MQPIQDPLLNQSQVAEMLGVKPRTLEDWRVRGGAAGPKFIRVSPRCVRYRQGDVMEWIEARSVSSTSEPIRAAA